MSSFLAVALLGFLLGLVVRSALTPRRHFDDVVYMAVPRHDDRGNGGCLPVLAMLGVVAAAALVLLAS